MEDRRYLPKDLVAEQVPEFVVEALELVDIDHQHSHSALESASAVNFFYDAQFKEAPVEDPGKAVEIGKLLDPFHIVRVLDGGGTDVGHCFQRFHIAFLEAFGPLTLEHQHAQCLTEGNQRDAHARLRLAVKADVLDVIKHIILDQRFAGGE